MNVRKLDRITIGTFCMNPYDLYLCVPVFMPKSMVRKKAQEYLRKEGKKDVYKKGYFRIKRGRIEKTDYDNTDLMAHKELNKNLKYDYELKRFYRCWIIPIEYIEEGEKISRTNVIKYKRIGRKRYETIQQRETEKAIDELIESFKSNKENGE